MKDYSTEAYDRYGNTDAYREHKEKTKHYSKEKWNDINEGLMSIFAEFAEYKTNGVSSTSDKAQGLVAKLQCYISDNYYTCTNEILAGLGKMYICDERFKKNIDKYGERTAEFAAEAIAIYSKIKRL